MRALRRTPAPVPLNSMYFSSRRNPSLNAQEVEQRYVDVLRAVKAVVSIPVSMKLSPYFSALAHMVMPPAPTLLATAPVTGLAPRQRWPAFRRPTPCSVTPQTLAPTCWSLAAMVIRACGNAYSAA